MCLKTAFNFTKKQGFTLFLEDTVFENSHGGKGDRNCPTAVLELKIKY